MSPLENKLATTVSFSALDARYVTGTDTGEKCCVDRAARDKEAACAFAHNK